MQYPQRPCAPLSPVSLQIVERGAHAELIEQGGLYAQLWNRQQEAAAVGAVASSSASASRPASQPASRPTSRPASSAALSLLPGAQDLGVQD